MSNVHMLHASPAGASQSTPRVHLLARIRQLALWHNVFAVVLPLLSTPSCRREMRASWTRVNKTKRVGHSGGGDWWSRG